MVKGVINDAWVLASHEPWTPLRSIQGIMGYARVFLNSIFFFGFIKFKLR